MSILENLLRDIFFIHESTEFQIRDRLSDAEFVCPLKYEKHIRVNKEKCGGLKTLFKATEDDWILNITLNGADPIQLLKNNFRLDDFIESVKDLGNVSEEDIKLTLKVQKTTSKGICHVYCYEHFMKWIKSRTALQFLNSINETIRSSHFINFKVNDTSNGIRLVSKRIQINSKTNEKNGFFRNLNEYCHFTQSLEYPYLSSDFEMTYQNNVESELTAKLVTLENLFALTSILDISALVDEKLTYKLNGFKSFEGELEVDQINDDYKIYSRINRWIYSDEGNISDKLGLARNIISIYLKKANGLKIEDDAYNSILSSHQIYLKKNISRYIDQRSRLGNELYNITSELRAALSDLTSNYQKSNYVYISFFISVFVLRVLTKGGFSNIFTKDATYIFFGLVGISALYLAYSLWQINAAKKRIEKRYEMVKHRYEDLLLKEDIEKILNGDTEFNDESTFLIKRTRLFTVLWVLSIVILSIAVLLLTEVTL